MATITQPRRYPTEIIGKVPPEVERAIRVAYDIAYDAQEAVKQLTAKLRAAGVNI